jgi:hypothetical protein
VDTGASHLLVLPQATIRSDGTSGGSGSPSGSASSGDGNGGIACSEPESHQILALIAVWAGPQRRLLGAMPQPR